MSSTALDRVDPIAALTEVPWIEQISPRQLELIQKTVAKGLNNAETGHFLEIARSLGMNPWANEIWAAKSKPKNGGEGKLLLMVGRDGLIGHAERNFDDYLGYDSGVVYEHDDFERLPEPAADAKTMKARAGVVHRQAHPKDRGDVVGAWAVCERRGRPIRYFYAALDEYMPTSNGQLEYSPWGSAVAAMIEKVPISITHRTLCGLGSVYLEEEVARARFDTEAAATPIPESRAELESAIREHVPTKLADRACGLIMEADDLAPNSWSVAKVEMTFKGKTAYAISAEVAAIEKSVEELRARPRSVVEDLQEEHVAQGGALADADVTDAEVVPDDGAQPASSEEAEVRERVKAKRIEDLEADLHAEDLTEERQGEIEDELDMLTSPPAVSGDQDTLPL